MPNKTKRGPSNTSYFKNYSSKAEKNKERKLNRHMKKHPNDKQSIEKLGIPVVYTSKKGNKNAKA